MNRQFLVASLKLSRIGNPSPHPYRRSPKLHYRAIRPGKQSRGVAQIVRKGNRSVSVKPMGRVFGKGGMTRVDEAARRVVW